MGHKVGDIPPYRRNNDQTHRKSELGVVKDGSVEARHGNDILSAGALKTFSETEF